MSENDHQQTWNVFTKFVFWGTAIVIIILIILALVLL